MIACTSVACSAEQEQGEPPRAASEVSGETTTVSAPVELPPGFFLSGEFVELGPYDPSDPAVEWIKPCTEIPADVLGGTGLDLKFSADDGFADMWTCSAKVEDLDYWGTTISITTGPTPVKQFVDAGLAVNGAKSERIPQAVVHEIFGSTGDTCAASLETTRGYFSVSAMNFDYSIPLLDRCSLAVSQLENLYQLLRGKNDADFSINKDLH